MKVIKMPYSLFKIFDSCFHWQNSLLRDFNQLHTFTDRMRMTDKAIGFLKKQIGIFLEDNHLHEYAIYLDGYMNMRMGIPMVAFVAHVHDSIFILDIFSQTYYWKNTTHTCINKAQYCQPKDFLPCVDTEPLLLSVACGWVVTGTTRSINYRGHQLVVLATDMPEDPVNNILKYSELTMVNNVIAKNPTIFHHEDTPQPYLVLKENNHQILNGVSSSVIGNVNEALPKQSDAQELAQQLPSGEQQNEGLQNKGSTTIPQISDENAAEEEVIEPTVIKPKRAVSSRKKKTDEENIEPKVMKKPRVVKIKS